MKPGKEIGNPELDTGNRSKIRRFLSGMAFFLAAIGIIVGVVWVAQHEVPMEKLDPGWIDAYSYWSVLKFSGPLAMLSFLFMVVCLGRTSFRQSTDRIGQLDGPFLLPMILGGCMAFLLLTGAWSASVNGGLDADIGTRYAILESKLQILVGATTSCLCYLITRLRLRIS